MTLYNTSITFHYRNGSQFTETYAKPQTLVQVVEKVRDAKVRISKESNLVDAELKMEKLDTSI